MFRCLRILSTVTFGRTILVVRPFLHKGSATECESLMLNQIRRSCVHTKKIRVGVGSCLRLVRNVRRPIQYWKWKAELRTSSISSGRHVCWYCPVLSDTRCRYWISSTRVKTMKLCGLHLWCMSAVRQYLCCYCSTSDTVCFVPVPVIASAKGRRDFVIF